MELSCPDPDLGCVSSTTLHSHHSPADFSEPVAFRAGSASEDGKAENPHTFPLANNQTVCCDRKPRERTSYEECKAPLSWSIVLVRIRSESGCILDRRPCPIHHFRFEHPVPRRVPGASVLGQANTGDRGTVGGGPYSGSGYTCTTSAGIRTQRDIPSRTICNSFQQHQLLKRRRPLRSALRQQH